MASAAESRPRLDAKAHAELAELVDQLVNDVGAMSEALRNKAAALKAKLKKIDPIPTQSGAHTPSTDIAHIVFDAPIVEYRDVVRGGAIVPQNLTVVVLDDGTVISMEQGAHPDAKYVDRFGEPCRYQVVCTIIPPDHPENVIHFPVDYGGQSSKATIFDEDRGIGRWEYMIEGNQQILLHSTDDEMLKLYACGNDWRACFTKCAKCAPVIQDYKPPKTA